MNADLPHKADWEYIIGSITDAIAQYDAVDPAGPSSWEHSILRLIEVPESRRLDGFEMYRVIRAFIRLIPFLIRCIPDHDSVLEDFFELAVEEVLADVSVGADLGPALRTAQLRQTLSGLAEMSLEDFAHELATRPGLDSIIHEVVVHHELERLEDSERRGWTLGLPPDDQIIEF